MIAAIRALISTNILTVVLFGGIIALIIGGWLRIQYLESTRDLAVARFKVIELSLIQAEQINDVNVMAVKELASKLAECALNNKVLEENSQQALITLREDLREVQNRVARDSQVVQEALKDEECTNIAIPSDAERVLRNGAANANRDRDS